MATAPGLRREGDHLVFDLRVDASRYAAEVARIGADIRRAMLRKDTLVAQVTYDGVAQITHGRALTDARDLLYTRRDLLAWAETEA